MSEVRQPDDPSDDERQLLGALRRAIPVDPVPEGLIERSQGLVSLLDLDRDLAELLETAQPELVGMRGGTDQAEELRFEVADGAVSIELVLDRDGISGMVLAGEVAQVVLEGGDGDLETSAVDPLGRFDFPRTTAHIVRLRLSSSTTRAVTTDWFLQ